ncbi:MAG: endonuclease/exonuclease/phosphatase family protein [Candidatus Liptonbacteria bacterium]|nr:endonuclease/exonuclease/phosphatase family protein [Candidatus Liptonbacteria bacterium]
MKLISLNIFGGKHFEPLMEFVRKEAPTTDIFCFQEVFRSKSSRIESRGIRTHLYEEFGKVLADFQGFFAAEQDGYDFEGPVDFDISTGQATFIRKSIRVASTEEVFVYRARNTAGNNETIPANMLCTRITQGAKAFSVINLHGLAHPPKELAQLEKIPHFLGHRDTPDRLAQSEKILAFLKKERGLPTGQASAIILCGDFNLRPETQSFAMLEAGMRNLMREFHVERTRSRHSLHFGKEDFDPLVDYVLVSHDVEAHSLTAPDIDISDHLPLVLEFS